MKKRISEDEFEHFCNHHLQLSRRTKSEACLEVSIVVECGQKSCPLPDNFSLYFCPSHPCPGRG